MNEHPQSASSWSERCIRQLLQKDGVQYVVGDQCMYGLNAKIGSHEGPARKRIGFLTNSPCVARRLSKRCPNTNERIIHEHVRLESGRASKAQVYLDALCRAICAGIEEQIKADQCGQFMLLNINNSKETI